METNATRLIGLLHYWKHDGQIAQYKCVEPDRDHSAHRVYLNSRTALPRLIVSSSFFFSFTGVTFALCDLSQR